LEKVIFAVDDCDMNLTVVEYALGNHYKIHMIDSLAQMFEELESVIPDLILLDLYMPEMTCNDAMKRLKAHSRHAFIPVIIMSGTFNTETINECNEMGAIHFISKPILDPVDFYEQVSRWV